MEKLKFRVKSTSTQGHSLIEWDHRPDGIPMRSLQVETKIAELWASAPEMKAKLQAAEKMARALERSEMFLSHSGNHRPLVGDNFVNPSRRLDLLREITAEVKAARIAWNKAGK